MTALATAFRRLRLWLGVPSATQSQTKRLGARGERAAAAFLRRAGYRILDRNVVLPMGEADIVALAPDARTIVLVEVKCRVLGDARHPPPESQVDARKRRKLRAILAYLTKANNWQDRPRRIDVIAIDYRGTKAADIRHLINIAV